jgi:hypothetical protein
VVVSCSIRIGSNDVAQDCQNSELSARGTIGLEGKSTKKDPSREQSRSDLNYQGSIVDIKMP